MAANDEIIQPYVGTIEHEGRRYNVSVRITWDGIEFVGRLWFADEALEETGLPDRGAFPGRTRDDVIAMTKRLTESEMVRRHRRALAEKRRFGALRKHTEEILAKIRYLNQVAISMRAGLLDAEGAAQEIQMTEQQMHALIDRVGDHAGIES
jgi:hypothetical protein